MSFSRYLQHKASGVEWLGDVPEGWSVSRIKWLGKTLTGGTPKTEEPAYWTDGDVPWLPSGKVQNNIINKEDADTFITKRALAESAAKLIRPGSALIALTGATCANAAYLTFESTANQSVVGIEPRFNSNGRFLYFSLLSQREQVLSHKSGGAQGGINQDDVRNLVITAPPLPEQRAIAEFLDRETGKIDELVAEQRRLMELLKEKRQAVISHAVTKGLNPQATMKPSGIQWLGDVPAGWEVLKLGHISNFKGGAGFPDSYQGQAENDIPFFKVGDMVNAEDSRVMRKANHTVTEATAKELRAFLFPARTIVFAKVGAALLLKRYRLLGQRSCIDNNMMGMSVGTAAAVDFLLYVLPLLDLDLIVNPGAVPSMNETQISGQKIALPPIEEQHRIVAALDDELTKFHTLTAEAQCAIDLLQERRTALISAAVTGQIDVRNPNIEAGA